jgi:hypothetical protein
MVDRILHTAGTRSAEVASRLGDLGRNVRFQAVPTVCYRLCRSVIYDSGGRHTKSPTVKPADVDKFEDEKRATKAIGSWCRMAGRCTASAIRTTTIPRTGSCTTRKPISGPGRRCRTSSTRRLRSSQAGLQFESSTPERRAHASISRCCAVWSRAIGFGARNAL